MKQRRVATTRSEDDLRRAGEDVNYEMMMLRECSERLRRPPSDRVLRNALLESYLVHLRNLLHFFHLGGQDYREDVFAEHFHAGKWLGAKEELREGAGDPGLADNCLQTLEFQMHRINKRLSHLSYGRLHTQREWAVGELTSALAPLIWQFLKPPPGQGPGWFPEAENGAFWRDGIAVRRGSPDQSATTTTVSAGDVGQFSSPGLGGSRRDRS